MVGFEHERATFADLYRADFAHMVRIAWLIVGSAAVAEDVVQDAFLRVGRRLDRVDSPVAYLRAAVVNGCRNELRRTKRFVAGNVPELVSNDSVMVELLDALATLDARQRTAIVLRYVADTADHEIAKILGVRQTTVRSLIFRGLKELRREIADG